MDKITIKDLEIYANHGVFPEENVLGQKFLVSAVLHTSTRKAGLTDDLTASIHYGEVSHLIKKIVSENTWKLLEKIAEETASAILLTYPLVSQVDITIKKPWAPIGLPLDTVSVEISIPPILLLALIWEIKKLTSKMLLLLWMQDPTAR